MDLRAALSLSLCLVAPMALADTPGACMLETPAGEAINIGPCVMRDPACLGPTCEMPFFWQADKFTTVISGGPAGSVRDATEMNGQEAYAPVALIDSDPRDCIYNDVSSAVFCWIPGAQAQALAKGGNAARVALMALAAGDASAPGTGGRKPAGEPGPDSMTLRLLAPMQGTYRVSADWTCTDIGMEGGATAIQGTQLIGVETICNLHAGQPVGAHGAALFTASCSGEGETWSDEILLRRDEYGTLAVLYSDAVTQWQACD